MVRNYKRKTKNPANSKEIILNVVEDIKCYRISIRATSIQYFIPKAILYNHLKGRRENKSGTYERRTVLSSAE